MKTACGRALLFVCLWGLCCGCSNKAESPEKPEPMKKYMGSGLSARTLNRWEESQVEVKSKGTSEDAEVHEFVIEVEGEAEGG